MIKPIGDTMIVEVWEEGKSQILKPNTKEASEGDTFLVKAMGEGTLLENGEYFLPNIKAGDRVWIVGRIFKLPLLYEKVLIAKMGNVIAVDRGEAIPDKI